MQGNQQTNNLMDFSGLSEALLELSESQQNTQTSPDPNQKRTVNIPTDILLKEIQIKKKKTEIDQKSKSRKNKKIELSKGYIDKLANKEKQHKKAKIDKNKKKNRK